MYLTSCLENPYSFSSSWLRFLSCAGLDLRIIRDRLTLLSVCRSLLISRVRVFSLSFCFSLASALVFAFLDFWEGRHLEEITLPEKPSFSFSLT